MCRNGPQPRTDRGSRPFHRTLGGAVLWAWVACTSTAFVREGGLLRHAEPPIAIPDLSAEGWRRIDVGEADLAFRKPNEGVIAIRLRCPSSEPEVPLRWEARHLWLGIEREDFKQETLRVDGHPAVEMSALQGNSLIRTVVVRVGACSLDLVQVAPIQSEEARNRFDRLLTELRTEPGPTG